MDLEKLESETSRLSLEVERLRIKWQDTLRRGFLFLAYQILFGLVLIYIYPESYKIVILIVFSSFLWELVDNFINWFRLKEAQKMLQAWKDTVNLANQQVE